MDDLISRQAAIELIERMKPYHQDADDIAEMIANLPSAQPEIIRCKDCKHKKVYCFPPKYAERDYCVKHEKVVDVADFCSWAERRTDGLYDDISRNS